MKAHSLSLLAITALLLGAVPLTFAQGTAFTYHGRLNDNGSPANGNYDLQFHLRDAETAGTPVSTTNTVAPVSVNNGLFTVLLDFGAGVFTGADRWLEIGVRTNGGGVFAALSPRQKLTPTPYAITAGNLSGTLPAAQLSGTLPSARLGGTYSTALTLNNVSNNFVGNGAELTGVNAAMLGGLGASSFWKLPGNGGTTPGVNFLGTTDNQPLELKVNGQRAFRFEPTTNSPNLIGGFSGNYVRTNTVGATISGGGFSDGPNLISSPYSPPNFGVIGGGASNSVFAAYGTISGGASNSIWYGASGAALSGGVSNRIGAFQRWAAIAGGINNWIGTGYLGGGGEGTAIGGGWDNTIGADSTSCSLIAGGRGNLMHALIAWDSAILGGRYNRLSGERFFHCVIAGGASNAITGMVLAPIGFHSAAIGGGQGNVIFSAPAATISGGEDNKVRTDSSSYGHGTIGGGKSNFVERRFGTIPGGTQAKANSYGQMAYASGQFATNGDAQTSVYVCRATTTNATPTELFLDGLSQRMLVSPNSTWSFDALVTGRALDGTSASYQILGEVKNNAGIITLGSAVTKTAIAEDVVAWDATAAADSPNGALVVRVTGLDATSIRWVASVRTVEVTY